MKLETYIRQHCDGNKSSFARTMNVNRQQVAKWIKAGRFVNSEGYLCTTHQQIPNYKDHIMTTYTVSPDNSSTSVDTGPFKLISEARYAARNAVSSTGSVDASADIYNQTKLEKSLAEGEDKSVALHDALIESYSDGKRIYP